MVECEKKLMSSRKVAGEIKALMNEKGLNLNYASVLYKSILIKFGSDV